MKRLIWRQSLRWSLAVLLVFAAIGPLPLAAQSAGDSWGELGEQFHGESADATDSPISGTTYVLPASGAEVILADGLEPEDSDFEDQIIVNTPQGMGAIAVLPGLGTPQSILETYVTAFGETQNGTDQIFLEGHRQSATGLYSVDLLGISMFMYITVDAVTFPGYLTIQVAIAETDIAQAIATMRENAAVNGIPMFAGVDEQHVQDMADDYQGS